MSNYQSPSESVQKLKEFLASDEGKEYSKQLGEKLKKQSEVKKHQLQRIHNWFSNDINLFIDKVYEKYNSNEYIQKHHHQPDNFLYWILYSYAEIYGHQCSQEEWEKYGNPFTADLIRLGNYYFNLMLGQGSFMKVMKSESDQDSFDKIVKTIPQHVVDKVDKMFEQQDDEYEKELWKDVIEDIIYDSDLDPEHDSYEFHLKNVIQRIREKYKIVKRNEN